jgi:hypothetical protein
MLPRLMYVTLYVRDQDRALEFSTERLGPHKRVDNPTPEGRFLTVAPADDSMEILLWPGNPAQGPVDAAEPRVVAGPVFLRSDDLARTSRNSGPAAWSSWNRSPWTMPTVSASRRWTPTGTGSSCGSGPQAGPRNDSRPPKRPSRTLGGSGWKPRPSPNDHSLASSGRPDRRR